MDKQDKIFVYSSGTLLWQGKEYKCALGRNGVSLSKVEGDGATPAGCFPLREVYYRKDRLDNLKTLLPIKILSPSSGWCNDPKDPAYNTFVELPYPASYENLWRADNIYDIIVILGYNDNPSIRGKGSAIFIHIARSGYTPTAGCIALSLPDLIEILKTIDVNTLVCVEESP